VIFIRISQCLESIIIRPFRLDCKKAAVEFLTFYPLDWVFIEPKKIPEAFGKFLLLFFELVGGKPVLPIDQAM